MSRSRESCSARRGPALVLGAALGWIALGCSCGGGPRTDAGNDGATTGGDAAATDALVSTDASGGGDGGADAGGDASAACGDPTAAALYDQCRAATDQPACEAAGGTWTTVGLAPSKECQCPTGQDGCPCTRPSECLSACVAPTGGGGPFDCAGVTGGSCSPVSITVGCWCWFDESGTPMGLCAD